MWRCYGDLQSAVFLDLSVGRVMSSLTRVVHILSWCIRVRGFVLRGREDRKAIGEASSSKGLSWDEIGMKHQA